VLKRFSPACCLFADGCKIPVPMGYVTWDNAIECMVSAREEGMDPDDVTPELWTVFETWALLLIPCVSK
jgi:hypothetical protein